LGQSEAFAQSANPGNSLSFVKPVTGTLSDTQPADRWTFSASKGELISARMQITGGDFTPALDLLDSADHVLVSGQNNTFHNTIIDGFALPEDGTYTLRAGRAESAKTGAYSLLLLPGYSYLLLKDSADEATAFRSWSEAHSSARPEDKKIRLAMALPDNIAWTTETRLGTFKDLYMQANVSIAQSSGYWEEGLLVRAVTRADGLNFYLLSVNSDGKWRFGISHPAAYSAIRDWTPMPIPLTPQAVIGIAARDDQFQFFYNGVLFGSLTDDTLGDPGNFGLAVGTGDASGSFAVAQFDTVIVTLPNAANSDAAIVPAALKNWQRAPELILDELHTARLIPSAGKAAIRLDTAFSRNSLPGGIVFVPLARSAPYTDIVYTSDITWQSSNDSIACALEFRATDANNFSILYLDRKGGYGIRQIDSGNAITTFYDLSGLIHKDNFATNRITLLAIGNGLIIYLNGALLANMTVKQATGGVSIAAYNYQPAFTRCDFNNLWLQTFDP
jgi:hypothetical protein